MNINRFFEGRLGRFMAVTMAEMDSLVLRDSSNYTTSTWEQAKRHRVYRQATIYGQPFIVVDLPPDPRTRVEMP